MADLGWSYPAGCSGPPEDQEGPCEYCGRFVDDCICPECPVCHSHGDPACYVGPDGPGHGLVDTPEQRAGREAREESYRKAAEAEGLRAETWEGSTTARPETVAWVTFTRRTDDPKLAYLERRLDDLGIYHRRNGFSFHAPILQVPEADLERADAILNERVDWWDGTEDTDPGETKILDDIDDDDPFWEEG